MPTRLDYASFVELSRQMTRRMGPTEQGHTVRDMIKRAVPPFVPPLLRLLARVLPPNMTYEANALIANSCFQWLVGPCEIKEVEDSDGTTSRTTVKIKKCRYLQVRYVF